MGRAFSSAATDRVDFGDDADLDASTGISIGCWVKHASVEVNDLTQIVSKWQAYTLRAKTSNGHRFTIWDGSAEFSALGGVPVVGRSYYYMCTYDGTTIKLRVYDSVADSFTNYTTAHSGSIDTNTNSLLVGTYEGLLTSVDFEGEIQDLKIWKNRALTEAQGDYERFFSKPKFHVADCTLGAPLGVGSPEPDFMGRRAGTVTGATVARRSAPSRPWSNGQILQFPLVAAQSVSTDKTQYEPGEGIVCTLTGFSALPTSAEYNGHAITIQAGGSSSSITLTHPANSEFVGAQLHQDTDWSLNNILEIFDPGGGGATKNIQSIAPTPKNVPGAIYWERIAEAPVTGSVWVPGVIGGERCFVEVDNTNLKGLNKKGTASFLSGDHTVLNSKAFIDGFWSEIVQFPFGIEDLQDFNDFFGSKGRSEEFLSSGFWICPPGVTSILVLLVAGGGGGGSGRILATNLGEGGGGGGAAQNCISVSITVVPGTVYIITVGAGGLGGLGVSGTSANSGEDGSNTSFAHPTQGILLEVIGGQGGFSGDTAGNKKGGSGGRPTYVPNPPIAADAPKANDGQTDGKFNIGADGAPGGDFTYDAGVGGDTAQHPGGAIEDPAPLICGGAGAAGLYGPGGEGKSGIATPGEAAADNSGAGGGASGGGDTGPSLDGGPGGSGRAIISWQA